MTAEQWTTRQVAAYLGIKPDTYPRYRKQGAPGPIGREPGRSGQNLYDADAVRVWDAHRPGRGIRTDLRRPLSQK